MIKRKYSIAPPGTPYFKMLTDEETGARFDSTDPRLIDGARLSGWGRKERGMLIPVYRGVHRGNHAGKVFYSAKQVEAVLMALNGEAGPTTIEAAIALDRRRTRASEKRYADLFCDPLAEKAS